LQEGLFDYGSAQWQVKNKLGSVAVIAVDADPATEQAGDQVEQDMQAKSGASLAETGCEKWFENPPQIRCRNACAIIPEA
jgi:hypothetical protein